jgi:hypothetical protein
MKSKKLFLGAIILAVAILSTAVYVVVGSIAQKPVITEGEFAISITYTLDGETHTINDVYKTRYVGNGGYADTKSRIYAGTLGNNSEGYVSYTLKEINGCKIELDTNLRADYMMGDPLYDYTEDEICPIIFYYDANGEEYSDEATLKKQGVELVSFSYPPALSNSFVFSHISEPNSELVPLMIIIALLALVAIIIFVRKDKELEYKAVDVVSIVVDFVIGFTVLPIVSLGAMLADINGGMTEFYLQIIYFFPSLIILGIAASVALRRRGYGVTSLITALVSPVAFGIYYTILSIAEMF